MSAPSTIPVDAATRSLILRHLATLIARVQAYFAQHQDAHLKRLRGHLFEQVDSRPNTTQAQNLRTAGVMLDKQAVIFNRAFQAALRESIEDEVEAVIPGAMRAMHPSSDQDDQSGPSSMALLDVDEIERHLLVDRVAQRFNSRYEPQLLPLTQSLATLMRQDEFALADNPFRPSSLVRAFVIAWHSSAFDPAAAEDFVSMLEPQASIDWAPLYSDLTAMLVRAGYSAKPVHRIKRTVGGDSGVASLQADSTQSAVLRSGFAALEPAASGRAGVPPTGATAPQEAGLQGMAQSFAARARQFLQKLGFGMAGDATASAGMGDDPGGLLGPAAGPEGQAQGGWTGGAHAGAPADGSVSHAPADPALMGFLGGLQAGAGASRFPQWAQGQDIAEQNVLRQMREHEEVQRAPDLDRGTVDALAEVFDYVFADKAIPLQLKFVIGRLQIPVLKAAIIDRNFFLTSEHPARQLVDALAVAAVGWTAEMGETDPLYQCIDSTVNRVLSEFDHDLGLFRDLLAEFNAFCLAHEQRAEIQIKPAANQEQLTEARDAALSHADEVVHQCIHALPTDAPLLPFLLPFLTHQWREVLARAWLVADRNPTLWAQAVKTMDQVIWSTLPKVQPDERSRLIAVLPDLVHQLDASLDAIGWTGNERVEFTRRLIETHMKAIRTPKPGLAVDSAPGELETRAGHAAVQALDQRLAPREQVAPDQFDAIAYGLERGMWFDFEHDADQTRRYRLGWISPQRSRMLFTNRDGFEAFVRSQREVAALLREGRLSIIDQQPIVKRAIDQIMSEGAPPSTTDLALA